MFYNKYKFFLNCLDQSRSSDDHFNLINSSNNNSVYNSNQMQYSTPIEISQYDLQASGKF